MLSCALLHSDAACLSPRCDLPLPELQSMGLWGTLVVGGNSCISVVACLDGPSCREVHT